MGGVCLLHEGLYRCIVLMWGCNTAKYQWLECLLHWDVCCMSSCMEDGRFGSRTVVSRVYSSAASDIA